MDVIATARERAKEAEALKATYSNPDVLSDPKEIARIGKRLAELGEVVRLIEEYDRAQAAINAVEEVASDPELYALAQAEASDAKAKIPEIEQQLLIALLPKDPDDQKSVIVEVRAGTGGEEAALFAAELLRMYLRYSEGKKWKNEVISMSDAGAGGIKEGTIRIEGDGVYGALKFESGVHRVQRIPATEAKGRIHTSTATVAILPEVEEFDLKIRPEDLKIDTFRSGGAGGQNVNKVESAIRITHIPTGTVVACQTERSQLKNRQLAMSLLRSRIYSAQQDKLAKERGDLRSGQIGSADRSEKIRTYNFPQDRITDHRVEKNFSNIPVVMEGALQPLLDALAQAEVEQRLKTLK